MVFTGSHTQLLLTRWPNNLLKLKKNALKIWLQWYRIHLHQYPFPIDSLIHITIHITHIINVIKNLFIHNCLSLQNPDYLLSCININKFDCHLYKLNNHIKYNQLLSNFTQKKHICKVSWSIFHYKYLIYQCFNYCPSIILQEAHAPQCSLELSF